METSFHPVDLNVLGQQLQSFLDECPLRVQCAIRDERLIVLGQHPEGIDLDASHVLKLLERKIQSLQIGFTQQVRLYLRLIGQRQPYAHRWFMIQPPPPPRRHPLTAPSSSTASHPIDSTVCTASDAHLTRPQSVAVVTRPSRDKHITDTKQPITPSQAQSNTDVEATEIAWIHASTRILDLDTPVLDAQVLQAIGLDDQELISSSPDASVLKQPQHDRAEHTHTQSSCAHSEAVNPKEQVNQIPIARLEPAASAAELKLDTTSTSGSIFVDAPITDAPLIDSPSTNPLSQSLATTVEDAQWNVDDQELDNLVNELTASASIADFAVNLEQQEPVCFETEPVFHDSPSTHLAIASERSASNEIDCNRVDADGLNSNGLESNALDLNEVESEAPQLSAIHAAGVHPDTINPNTIDNDPEFDSESYCALFHNSISQEVTGSTWALDQAAQPITDECTAPDDACVATQHALESAADARATHQSDPYPAVHESPAERLTSSDSIDLLDTPISSWQHSIVPLRSLPQQAGEQIRGLSRVVIEPVRSHVDSFSRSPLAHIDGRVAIAASVTAIGVTGALYTLTRPCAVGACPQLTAARDLSEKSAEMMRQAASWRDLERAETHLNQAVETLEPIPLWSGYVYESKELIAAYSSELERVEALLDVEDVINAASRTSQGPLYSLADWQAVRSLWQQAIMELEAIPSDSDLYAFARQQLRTYRQRKAQIDQHIALEERARDALEKAKQAAQLAQARQGSAQSLENWQFARVTWIVALDRLQLVPEDTLAFLEAESLTESYQTSLDAVTRRVEREQIAQQQLQQAEQRAKMAQAAEQRLDWPQAVSDWQRAIAHIQDIEDGTSPHPQAEELLNTYNQALGNAEEKQIASERIQLELEKTCIGEIRICNLLSVGEVIKVRLDDGYVRAIDAARSSGNNSIQAVVTDHQLILRRALELIANEYDMPVEVYNPENTLLERHSPRE